MRLGIVSDSHGVLTHLHQAVKKMGQIDTLLHAGDHYEDAIFFYRQTGIPVIAVVGNCDFQGMAEEEEVFDLAGKKIFLTHGHQYDVKHGLDLLMAKAKTIDVEIVVFGHTHRQEMIKQDGVLFFNPGSISLPRLGSYGYGIIEISNDGKISAQLFEL